MASREGSRKRQKISRTEGIVTTPDMSTSSSALVPAKAATTASGSDPSSNHLADALVMLKTDMEAMRQLVTCKICNRLLYEPYTLSCGHTHCYSCLSQWLGGNNKKTCPDCRAVVRLQPTPSYLVRELVVTFISRSHLLPDGETTEEHHDLAREEAKIVADDRANTDPRTGGLFKGCFSRGGQARLPIHDTGDRVWRCPECYWELEDGFCAQCGRVPEGTNESDYDSEDDYFSDGLSGEALGTDAEDDYFGEDDFDGDNSTVGDADSVVRMQEAAHHAIHPPARRRGTDTIDLVSNDSEEDEDEWEDEDDDEQGNLMGFVVGDDQVELETSDDGSDTDVPDAARSRRLGRRRAPVVISDDEDDEDDTGLSMAADQGSTAYDSEDEGPIAVGGQRMKRGGVSTTQPVHVVSDLDETGSSGSDDDDEESVDTQTQEGGFSPLDESVEDASSTDGDSRSGRLISISASSDDEDEDQENDEEDEGDDDQSGTSDSEAGWDTPAETPRAARVASTNPSLRLATLGQRSNRHASPTHRDLGFFRASPSVRTSNSRLDTGGTRRLASDSRLPSAPAHPFQLENVLATANYNQRARVYQAPYSVHWVGGPRGNGAVGVNVGTQSSSSSGSNNTVRPEATSRRSRKRALSMVSVDSGNH